MQRDPTIGVSGAKPRFKPAKQELPKLSREYLKIRNRQMSTKAMTAEMILAQQRGELIEKRLVERQAAFLLLSLRQRVLAVPDHLARQLINIADARKTRAILKEAMLALLQELASLPSQITNPKWLDELADEKDA